MGQSSSQIATLERTTSDLNGAITTAQRVAIVDGQVSWDFNHYYTIAKAIAQASTELGVSVRWGGAWTVITNKNGTPQDWVKAYKAERKRLGKKEFLDGVHFEIPA